MKRKLLFLSLLMGGALFAQNRYLDPVFSQVTVTNGVTYGTNVDFLKNADFSNQTKVGADITALKTAVATGQPIAAAYYNPADTSTVVKVSDLKMDIYEPANDSITNRPVFLYVHTGNFLPAGINGQPTGSKSDSLGVHLCMEMAKRGYVSVAVDYRFGWNPIATTVFERRGTLLNAVYRAIHDVKQSVRYLKDDAVNANTYGIDPSKIVLFGQGSGGYVSLAYATMDKGSELFISKFINPLTSSSYVDTTLVGNLDGFNGLLNLYIPNGQNADISFEVNLGGALADTSWLEAGDVPMVSFQSVRDPFAPYDHGTVIVPTTNEAVVDVQGQNYVISKANALGNNAAFTAIDYYDVYTSKARSRYGKTYSYYLPAPLNNITVKTNMEGAYPVIIPLAASQFQNQGAPWEWWDPNSAAAQTIVNPGPPPITAHQAALQSNPNMSAAQGMTYADTIFGYMLPRVMYACKLGNYQILGADELNLQSNLSIYPNPAKGILNVNIEIESAKFEIISLDGKNVLSGALLNGANQLSLDAIPAGVYVLKVSSKEGVSVKRFIKN